MPMLNEQVGSLPDFLTLERCNDGVDGFDNIERRPKVL